MKQSAIAGILAFVAAAVLSGGAFFAYQHFTLVGGLTQVLSGQCAQVGENVIDAAVRRAVAEATETEEETETKSP